MVDDGPRRRHSTHFDLDSSVQDSVVGNDVASAFDTPSRSATDSNLPSQLYTGTAGPLQPTRSRSCDHITRVRFSSDVEHTSRQAQQRRQLSQRAQQTNIPASTPSAIPSGLAQQRSSTPILSIDTQRAAELPQSTKSPVRSPLSPKSPGSHTSQLSASKTPPLSARSRDRGYSLRRTIFNKVVPGVLPEPPIELAEPGPSHEVKSSQDSSLHSKKSLQSITVNQIGDADDHRISVLPHYETWIQETAAKSRLTEPCIKAFRRVQKFILRINEIPPSKDGRHIEMDAARKTPLIDERTGRPYIDNTIRSSRYTLWSFFPRQFWAQFSRLANAYFLFVSILQMIPGLSTTGTYTTIAPLMFFVAISMAKEGYDDLRRYRLDKEENNREASVFRAYQPTPPEVQGTDSPSLGPKVWARVKWKDVLVGDIVKLERDDTAPADLILLHSSGEENTAYIETMALDGETNLKGKRPTPSLASSCDTIDKLAACNAYVVAEDPNLDLYTFEGRVGLNAETVPLTLNEVIYRGSVLRNTAEAYGLVIYSGEECKIRMNANKNPRIKAPSLQSRVNKVIIFMGLFVIALAIANSVAYEIWQDGFENQLWYLSNANVPFLHVLVSFIIMFNTMIPLSLYISLEIVKVFQRLLLNDLDMYDEVSDTPMEARTSTINEELGQISHIFSDKTGTLTDNCMKFRKMSVAGTAWLHDSDLKLEAAREMYRQRLRQRQRGKSKRAMFSTRLSDSRPSPRRSDSSYFLTKSGRNAARHIDAVQTPPWHSSAMPAKTQRELPTVEMLHYIQRRPFTIFARKARFFLLSIALCHTCLPELRTDGSITYQAASPDELALIQAAQEMGYIMVDRKLGVITVKTCPEGPDKEPQFESYEILDVIEFSSKRKRMSVLVKFPDERICVICKGADSAMLNLLRLSNLAVKKVAEIDRKTNMRKSLEAHEALARKSEHHESLDLVGRYSMTKSRASSGGLGRASGSVSHQSIHAHVDAWLGERERDVESAAMDDTLAYSPRPSAQFARTSVGISEQRASSLADEDFELVEEALAVDEGTIVQRCFQHIDDFATEGLRTLMYGHRFLDEDEYATWKKVYQDATTSIVDRQEMIEKAGELIERGFELTGATAIEDKLQLGVPETIDKLRRANIKLWMLTGDKRETAINIGHSCRLIKDYSTITILDKENKDMEKHMAAATVSINRGEVAHSVIVVDGQTLTKIENSSTLKSLFVNLAPVADSVICCRASPSQKALLVRTIRRKVKSSITLAIGDGANDIAMIQEAHVGIGLTGKEGLQAARTSDYSIAQFRFLSKLLLVHGRWNYIRTCKYTLATFWKEMMFYLTQALYQYWVGYTGTSLYESWSLTTFNTLFTSLPVIILGIFEKDLQPATLLAVPELYSKGQRCQGFNFRLFAYWIVMAMSESALIYCLMYKLFASGGSFDVPANDNIFPMGDLTFTAVVITISAKLQLLEMHNISSANVFALVLSIGGWFVWNCFIAGVYSDNTIYKVKGAFFNEFGKDLSWWATLLCILIIVASLELGIRSIKAALKPSDTDVFQVLEKDPTIIRRFQLATGLELQSSRDANSQEDQEVSEQTLQMTEEQAKIQAEREVEIAELLRKRINTDRRDSGRPSDNQDVSSIPPVPDAPALLSNKRLTLTTSRSAPASLVDV